MNSKSSSASNARLARNLAVFYKKFWGNSGEIQGNSENQEGPGKGKKSRQKWDGWQLCVLQLFLWNSKHYGVPFSVWNIRRLLAWLLGEQ